MIVPRSAVGFALILVASATAHAQTTGPAAAGSWAAWAGCWRLVAERGTVAADDQAPLVCVTEIPGGARLTTTAGDQTPLEQTILSDGADHPVDEAGCRGTQRGDWSRFGPRLYLHAELTCAGDAAPRRVSGYSLLAQDGTWLDIQAVEIASRDTVRIRRYRRADADAAPRAWPGRSLGIDDVKEASARVSSAAIEAAVVETGAAIPLSSKTLIELDAAGVSDRVIDLMIAVAYPKKFVVERSTRADRGPLPPSVFDDPFSFGFFGYPMWASTYGLYDFYYGSPFYYTPFAYSYYGRFDPRFLGSGTVFVSEGGGTPRPQPSGSARAVDGRGYTQVRPRDPAQADRARQAGTDGASSSASTSSSSSSSSGSASPSGYSGGGGGGGGGDSGRTAVPR